MIYYLHEVFGVRIVVEHKDRFTRFGVRGYRTLLQNEGCDIEVVNEAENGKEDLLQVWWRSSRPLVQGFMDRGDARERPKR